MMKLIESRSDEVVAVEISEKVTRKDYQEIEVALQELLDRHGRIKVMLILGHYTGFSLDIFLAKLDFIKKNYRHCERVAYVSESKCLEHVVDIQKHFIKADVKHFDHTHLDEAWSWLAQN